MLDKITVKGMYKGKNERGTMIGGVLFKPMVPQMAHVDVATYKSLKAGVINGWFHFDSHNYNEYLKSRTKTNPFDGISVKEKSDKQLAEALAKDEIKVAPVEKRQEVKEEVKEEAKEETKKKPAKRKSKTQEDKTEE